MTSFNTLVQDWGNWTSKNADGGGVNTDINGDDALFKKKNLPKISYDIRDCKVENYELPTASQTSDYIENESDSEMNPTSEFELGSSYSTQTSVTNGFKAAAKGGLQLGVASMEISVEVSTAQTETVSKVKEEKSKHTIPNTIPPNHKIKYTRQKTNQIARFTGTLRVSGQVGVYFEKAICNAFGDGSKDKHYRWYPNAVHIVKWAIDQGYENWFISGDGYGCFKLNGKSEVVVNKIIIGKPEPI